jgi:hypothetical protein
MLTSATAPQMPSTATGRAHRAIGSRAGGGAEQDEAGGHYPQIQIVSATIGTWSCVADQVRREYAAERHGQPKATDGDRRREQPSGALLTLDIVGFLRHYLGRGHAITTPVGCAGERHVMATPRHAPSLPFATPHAWPEGPIVPCCALYWPSAGGLGTGPTFLVGMTSTPLSTLYASQSPPRTTEAMRETSASGGGRGSDCGRMEMEGRS